MAFRKGKQAEVTATQDPEMPLGTGSTYIDAGAELAGRFQFNDSVRIEGHVEGEIRAVNSVIVGESANVEANIDADAVEVFGGIEGDIRVNRKVTLHKSAQVNGEIQCAGIVVEEGARFRGCILIGDDPPSEATAPESDPEPPAKS